MAIFLLIFLLLLVAYSILIDYYRRRWNGIRLVKTGDSQDVKVSVVVAVRNEEKNIEKLVSLLSAQRYPRDLYEIIIVDDHSSDGTYDRLKSLSATHSLTLIQLPEGITSKKKAIERGLHAANCELIITTDADCEMGEHWLSSFASFYRKTGAQFIAAPVKMESGSRIQGIFQTLDFLAMQGITGASVSSRFHTMCNGANLGYTKKAFLEVNGFEGIDDIPSGDDMLLMHKIYLTHPDLVLFMKNPEAIVTTYPEASWKDFINQRIRWASKAVHFKDKKVFYVLLLTYVINVCFLVLAVAALFDIRWLSFLFLLLFAKVLIEFPFVNAVAQFFRQQKLMRVFPFLQPLHILYIVISGWLGRFGSYKWKARIIKNKGTGNLVKQ